MKKILGISIVAMAVTFSYVIVEMILCMRAVIASCSTITGRCYSESEKSDEEVE